MRKTTGLIALVFAVLLGACDSEAVPPATVPTAPTAPLAPPAATAATAALAPPAATRPAAATNTPSAADGVFGTNGPIPIGLAIALTGPAAAAGADEANGAKIAEKYFNDKGGVNGRPIRIVTQDTGGDEAGAIRAFMRLMDEERVIGIVGPTTSQQALAVGPVATRGRTPMLSPSTTAQGIPGIGEYVSRTGAPVSVVAPVAVAAAVRLHPDAKRAAIFYAQNDAAAVGETEVFQTVAKMRGLTVVSVQKHQTTDPIFLSQVTAALAQRPDIAFVSGQLADSSRVITQLRVSGFDGPVVGGDGVNATGPFSVCRAACNGVILAQAYNPDAANSANTTFKFAYLGQFKEDPPQLAAQTFAAVQVFVEALKVVDTKGPISAQSLAAIRVALNVQAQTATYATPLGDISFKERDIVQSEFYPARVQVNADGITGRFAFIR